MNVQRLLVATLILAIAGCAVADWPTWGRTPQRNMVSPETGILADFDPGRHKPGTDRIDPATTRNVKWVAKLGSQTYGNPSIANGRVYVGTNNDGNPDPRFQGDFSLLKALDEQTGEMLWQVVVPKFGSGKVGDWEYLGICSSAAVEDDRVYIITSRADVLCLDAKGLSNGNTGPFKEEGQYMIGPDHSPVELQPHDADIIWQYDMREDLGVFPHNITSSSPLIVGDYLYIATSNGVDWSHTNIPNPRAPSLIVLNKHTGELAGEEVTGMGERILHGGWSSPTYGEVDGKGYILFGGPDGFMYAFEPEPVFDEEEGVDILKEVWRFDGNPRHYRFRDGDESQPIRYARPDGPSEYIATPVVYDGKVYAAIGQDPEHGEGVGSLACLDLATGEVVWQYNDINRSISTVAIIDDLLFIGDFRGFVYCFNAQSGELHWRHDTLSHIWGSPLVVDGKVYIGNEDGDLVIYAASAEKKVIDAINFGDAIYSSPVVANGVLYVATMTQLYAIGK